MDCKIRFEDADGTEREMAFGLRLHTMGRVQKVRSLLFDTDEAGKVGADKPENLFEALRECLKGADTVDFSNADSHDMMDAALFFLRWTPNVGA